MTSVIPRDAGGDEGPWMEKWQARTGCPPPELLLPAREGSILPGGLEAAVRAHVAGCRLCAELAAVLDEIEAQPSDLEMQRINRRLQHERRATGRSWRVPLAAAAAVFAIAGAGYFLKSMESPATSPASEQTSAPPAVRVPVLALNAPPILLPPESLTLRGEQPNRYGAAIQDALTPFAAGDYVEASARLQRVTTDHPRRPHAQFYLGAARLLNGAAAEAVAPLESARALAPSDSALHAEATWYLALALERSGRAEAVVGPLNELCGGNGPRKAPACEGLRSLSNR